MPMFARGLIFVFAALLASAARAQSYTETFETQTPNATAFASNGVTFNIVSRASVLRIQANYPGTGWNGVAADNRYIDNSGTSVAGLHPDFSLKTADGSRFQLARFWLFLSRYDLSSLGSGGSVTLTGKLAGSTVFTASASSGFTSNIAVANGFSLIDLSTFGSQNNSGKTIDEIAISTGGNFEYVSLDAMTWTRLYTITIATSGSGSLVCSPNPLPAGSSATCTATPGAGYVVQYISGCGGTISHTASFTTGPVNADCTVTATFVPPLQASIGSHSDVSCHGGSNGSAQVTATGGQSPYSYSWSPYGGTGQTANNLAAGNFTVTVTDNFSNSTSANVTISEPPTLVITTGSVPNGLYGSVYSQPIAASGGTPGYGLSLASGSLPPGLGLAAGALSGTPNAAGSYSFAVKVTDANGCTATQSYGMDVLATVGGTLDGLAPGASVTLAWGAATLTLSGNGGFTFPGAVASGTPYAVTVQSQPTTPQFCNVENGSGSVGSASVTGIAVHCRSMTLDVADGTGYLGYGEPVDYLVVLGNPGTAPAVGVHLDSLLSPAFDPAFTQWSCLDTATAGAACSASGTGPLSDVATVPAGGQVRWLLHAQVAPATAETSADLAVTADGASAGTDSDLIVLFRNGFDPPPP